MSGDGAFPLIPDHIPHEKKEETGHPDRKPLCPCGCGQKMNDLYGPPDKDGILTVKEPKEVRALTDDEIAERMFAPLLDGSAWEQQDEGRGEPEQKE